MMEQSSEYLGMLVIFLLSAALAGLMLFLNATLGPKNKGSEAKSEPFECGLAPLAVSAGRFSIKFYLIAMLFILFDVEIVWLFPWAVSLAALRWAGLWVMFSFLLVFALGFIYVWKKGALEWEK